MPSRKMIIVVVGVVLVAAVCAGLLMGLASPNIGSVRLVPTVISGS